MTAAQQLRQQGMQQGMLKKSLEIAKRMLARNIDKSLIEETTGLSKEEIEAL